MQAIFVFFGLLLLCTFASTSDVGYCSTSECTAERRHSMMIQEYQKEITKFKETLQESGCSICNVEGTTPCLNNGTCIVTGPYKYICDCPDDTAGDDCGTLLTCAPGDCGTNATCTVFNHKKVCTCPPGYGGDPNVKCDVRTKRACMTGDPHYTTFDGTTFDYMGTCPYYVMTSCNSDDFSIIGTNTFTDSRKIVSYITEFTLKTQGSEFRVDRNLYFYVNGIRQYYPYYWPSINDPKIVATKPANQVIIQDNQSGAIITFAYAYLCAEVPLNEVFYGNNTMCGIWGSINDICGDDIKDKSGNVFVEPVSCAVGTNLNAIHFMDSWVTDSTVNNCEEGEVVTNMTSACTDVQAAQNQCDLIRQAMNGLGPFANCTVMGHDVIDKAFHDCTFDVCHSYPLCAALDTFATECNQFPFTNIDDWRDISHCPYPCPPHSHYSMKTPKCQNSCADPDYSNSSICHDGYEEGCTCDPNYYFDSNGEHSGFSFACRALDDCGCVDESGHYYPPHDQWLNVNCTVATQCSNGQLTSSPIACSSNGQCNNINGFSTCQCLPGYTGDGYNCTDINECLDPCMCNANVDQGICTNLPGTYNCTCYSPYSGSQCESYTPCRHCADLQIFHGITQNGTYSISIGANYTSHLTDADLTWTEVFCDMESNGGGWTLMAHGNGSSGKTFREYARGFGDPTSPSVWLGLENIHAMTATPTSLRIIIEQCATDLAPDSTDECTYAYFSVSDSNSQYAVFLDNSCIGPANGRFDGWITWNRSQLGPKFYAFDEDTPYNCSNTYLQTGWWFNYVNAGGDLCGAANLNGLRYACGGSEYQYTGKYLSWGHLPVEDAYMYLRPRDYPSYDNHHNDATTTTTVEPDFTSEP